MRLEPGTMIGRYQVLDRIGIGGMGEVYRAHDTRLDRIVAIKTIGAGFIHDATAGPRFERERRVTTSLEHPHICRVLDTESQHGVEYLVMEFLEGESLAARLKRGPVRLMEAIGYAIEIAEGLAYAHQRGVVHRDVKPANIFLTATGTKVLDFGLAKLRQVDAAAPLVDQGDTAPAATHMGELIGTTLYMAPERLEGREADVRTDVFGFGLLLYEMLSGRRAFEAPNTAALIAAILTSDPPALNLPGRTGADLEWITARCLAKNPADRWQSMADIASVLKRVAVSHGAQQPRPGRSRRASRRVAITAAAGLVVIVGGIAAAGRYSRTGPPAPGPPVAISVPPPPNGRFTPTEGSVQSAQLAMSPDGRNLAFVATGADGVSQLWVRPIDSTESRAIPGTVHATYPFWSANGHSIGFFTESELRRVDVEGGPSRALAATPNGRGGDWSAQDVILFAPNAAGVIYRVNADGSGLAPVTTLAAERAETSHRWPRFLPDGRQFIYFVRSTDQTHTGIYQAALDAPAPTMLAASEFGGVYAPPGDLLYVEEGALVTRQFDTAHKRLTGERVTITNQVGASSNFYGAFSVSRAGVLAYANRAADSELVWMNGDGERVGVAAPRGQYVDFQLSPDGRSLALAEIEPHSDRSDIHVIDLVRGTDLRLTTDPATDASPLWSPDGARLVFRSNRQRVHDLYMRPSNGTGADELLVTSASAKYPTAWSPDGRAVLYHADDDRTRWDIWSSSPDRLQPPTPLVRTEFDEMQGQISPDGRWLAYTSDQSARAEVYVQPVKGEGRRWQISIGGGSDPHWRRDGKELFYVARDGGLTSVTLRGYSGPDLDPAAPHVLFRIPPPPVAAPYTSAYDVNRTGDRFLVRLPLDDLQMLPLTVIVNWSPRTLGTR